MENSEEKELSYYERNKEKIKAKYQSKKIEKIEKSKEYYHNNKDNVKEYQKQYRDSLSDEEKLKMKEYQKEYQKCYREKNSKNLTEEKIEKRKEYRNNWQNKNKNKIAEKVREKYNNDPLFKLSHILRTRIRESFDIKKCKKNNKTEKILGCTFKQFKIYLESKFEDWMTWDNHGKSNDGIFAPNKSWDIDHIIPLHKATTEEEIIKLNHYTNLQPLCSYVNRIVKKNKIKY